MGQGKPLPERQASLAGNSNPPRGAHTPRLDFDLAVRCAAGWARRVDGGRVTVPRIGGVHQQTRRDEGDVQQLGGAPFGVLRPPVVQGGRIGRRVAGEALDARDVGTGVEQFTDEGTAQVVRGQRLHAGLVGQEAQAKQHRLVGNGASLDVAALAHRAQQRVRPGAAASDPGFDGLAAAGRAEHVAVLPALAAADRDLSSVEVVEQQRHGLAAAQPAAVQQGGVASARGLVAAGAEQRGNLAGVDVAAGGECVRLDVGHIGDALLGLGIDEARRQASLMVPRTAESTWLMVAGLASFVQEDRA